MQHCHAGGEAAEHRHGGAVGARHRAVDLDTVLLGERRDAGDADLADRFDAAAARHNQGQRARFGERAPGLVDAMRRIGEQIAHATGLAFEDAAVLLELAAGAHRREIALAFQAGRQIEPLAVDRALGHRLRGRLADRRGWHEGTGQGVVAQRPADVDPALGRIPCRRHLPLGELRIEGGDVLPLACVAGLNAEAAPGIVDLVAAPLVLGQRCAAVVVGVDAEGLGQLAAALHLRAHAVGDHLDLGVAAEIGAGQRNDADVSHAIVNDQSLTGLGHHRRRHRLAIEQQLPALVQGDETQRGLDADDLSRRGSLVFQPLGGRAEHDQAVAVLDAMQRPALVADDAVGVAVLRVVPDRIEQFGAVDAEAAGEHGEILGARHLLVGPPPIQKEWHLVTQRDVDAADTIVAALEAAFPERGLAIAAPHLVGGGRLVGNGLRCDHFAIPRRRPRRIER